MFVITKEWFDSNRDFISGLNRAQAEAIGETYPLKKGWKERVLGKVITLEQKKAYEDAKGLVYAVRKKKVKTSREMKSLLLLLHQKMQMLLYLASLLHIKHMIT